MKEPERENIVISLDLYLLCALQVYALGVYSLGLPISDLDLYFLCALVNQRQMGQVTVKRSGVPALVLA